jgi:hypothetical protein
MNLDEWRKAREEGEDFILPSGLEVRLRRADPFHMAEHGDIPAPITSIADEWFTTEANNFRLTTELWNKIAPFVNVVVKACLVSPKIGDPEKLKDGEISIDELDSNDRFAIYLWAMEVAAVLRPFRPEKGEPSPS